MVSKVDGAPDYLDAAPVSDGVAVRMSENVALVLTQLVGELIRFLETGELELREPRNGSLGFTPDPLLRNMFPPA